jgi:hypothetical protein
LGRDTLGVRKRLVVDNGDIRPNNAGPPGDDGALISDFRNAAPSSDASVLSTVGRDGKAFHRASNPVFFKVDPDCGLDISFSGSSEVSRKTESRFQSGRG